MDYQIKSKLVAAREPGIDKAKVQTEITQLQKQLTSIASSASFSGQNWLSVDSSASGYNATKSIVSSFTRTGSAVAVQTIDIDTSKMVLFDGNTTTPGGGDGSSTKFRSRASWPTPAFRRSTTSANSPTAGTT